MSKVLYSAEAHVTGGPGRWKRSYQRRGPRCALATAQGNGRQWRGDEPRTTLRCRLRGLL